MQLRIPLLAIHHMSYIVFVCTILPPPLDAMVSTPASDPVSNADEFALQTFEHLQEATAFVCQFTGKNMQRMKRYCDSSVKPQRYNVGEKVLCI